MWARNLLTGRKARNLLTGRRARNLLSRLAVLADVRVARNLLAVLADVGGRRARNLLSLASQFEGLVTCCLASQFWLTFASDLLNQLGPLEPVLADVCGRRARNLLSLVSQFWLKFAWLVNLLAVLADVLGLVTCWQFWLTFASDLLAGATSMTIKVVDWHRAREVYSIKLGGLIKFTMP